MTERTLEDFISNIKSERREEDVLYEVLLKYGLSLDLPIEKWRIEAEKNSQLTTQNSLIGEAATLYSIDIKNNKKDRCFNEYYLYDDWGNYNIGDGKYYGYGDKDGNGDGKGHIYGHEWYGDGNSIDTGYRYGNRDGDGRSRIK